MESLNYIIENQRIEIETVDEDFSSVQSGEIVSDFKKNATTDTISAMIILERRKQSKKSETLVLQRTFSQTACPSLQLRSSQLNGHHLLVYSLERL